MSHTPACFKAISDAQQQLQLFLEILQSMKLDRNGIKGEVLLRWFQKAQLQPSTVLTVVCPDYPKIQVNGGWEYTFDGLGDGVGLVAQYAADEMVPRFCQLQKVLPALSIVLAMADMEADNNEVLVRSGHSFEVFMERMRRSQRALQKYLRGKAKELNTGILADTPLLTRDRRSLWLSCVRDAQKVYAPEEGKFPSGVSAESCNSIFLQRRKLYNEWSGGDPAMARRLFDDAVRQYMAVGRFVEQTYPNPLIVGADSALMGQFTALWSEAPVIYLRAIY